MTTAFKTILIFVTLATITSCENNNANETLNPFLGTWKLSELSVESESNFIDNDWQNIISKKQIIGTNMTYEITFSKFEYSGTGRIEIEISETISETEEISTVSFEFTDWGGNYVFDAETITSDVGFINVNAQGNITSGVTYIESDDYSIDENGDLLLFRTIQNTGGGSISLNYTLDSRWVKQL